MTMRKRYERAVSRVAAERAYTKQDLNKVVEREAYKVVAQKAVEERQAITEAVLCVLHDVYDFDVEQLHAFTEKFTEYYAALNERYEFLADQEVIDEWYCHTRLLDLGIDLDTDTWSTEAHNDE